jgi:hypothetical protein
MNKPQVIRRQKEHSNPSDIWCYDLELSKPGAFRTVSVEALLGNPSCVELVEWPFLSNRLTYAAISHVWKFSDTVEKKCKEASRPFVIDTNEGHHTISWLGLIEVASAARAAGCNHLWLDFLCIDQVGREDKKLQVQRMKNIYIHEGPHCPRHAWRCWLSSIIP